eukprot:m.250263 g.250263  ORF g.250263 m.250263 type:complete len:487 (+) comp40314_c1_seq3:60-1520(+)
MVIGTSHGSAAALFFCLNTVAGAGFLGIPYVLYHGGLLYGVCLIVLISFLSIAAAEWTIEAMARAESFASGFENGSMRWRVVLVGDKRKFEVGEMCRMFIHPWVGHIYDISLLFSTCLCLWAYGALAASSWSSEIAFSGSTFRQCDGGDFLHKLRPDGACWNAYSVCILIFGAIVVPLSCLDLQSQVAFQIIMGCFRILLMVSMSAYSLAETVQRNATISTLDSQRHIWLHFDFRQWFSGVIPVVSAALTVHPMIPTFCQSVRNKKQLRSIFVAALSMAAILYTLVGITVALFFASEVNETCTLNWIETMKPGNNFLLRVYSYLVVLLPSIDLCSGYPLIVNVMVNVFYSLCRKVSGVDLVLSLVIGRFCVATLPLIGAVFISNLEAVLGVAGLVGYFGIFTVPGLLHFFSKWKSIKIFDACAQQPEYSKIDAGNIQFVPGEYKEAVGDVDNCYKPVVGKSSVAIAAVLFGFVAFSASVLSWFSEH